MDLFSQNSDSQKFFAPLAERVRPARIDQFTGQKHLLGEGKILQSIIQKDEYVSMILWGPPGVGKTTLARLIAAESQSDFFTLSAVSSGVADIRKVISKAKENRIMNKRSVLFIDEIHRFNKAQQDALLHSVEEGVILLIGATTENPGFEIISPLLSRCRVFKMEPLEEVELGEILDRALKTDELLVRKKITFQPPARKVLISLSGGDARTLLTVLELAAKIGSEKDGAVTIDEKIIQEALQRRTLLYDKKGDYHYDIISAFIKSVRGSDPDAAIYWLARMLESGEEPKFIARRLVISASEDIGNADPHALMVATSAFQAVTFVGMPEAQIVLAQATAYLASAPKSNASYLAIKEARETAAQRQTDQVPLHLRNAPTRTMQELGYAEGYLYPHDYNGFVEQNYFPKNFNKTFYKPTENGVEKRIRERLLQLWPKRKR
ncbi:replication-associated recombination protein A [candidate division KSB1 bacterium]|nr:replication-associated recombination protein A [candidate division KSB1 bacterium]